MLKVTKILKVDAKGLEGLKGTDTYANMLMNKIKIESDDIDAVYDALEQTVSYGLYYVEHINEESLVVSFSNINDMVQFINLQQGITPQLNPMAEALSVNIDNVKQQ